MLTPRIVSYLIKSKNEADNSETDFSAKNLRVYATANGGRFLIKLQELFASSCYRFGGKLYEVLINDSYVTDSMKNERYTNSFFITVPFISKEEQITCDKFYDDERNMFNCDTPTDEDLIASIMKEKAIPFQCVVYRGNLDYLDEIYFDVYE